jgi:hypothetical protein
MFALYEPGHRVSRTFGPRGANFFTRTRQYPRTPGGQVFVIYVAA